MLALVCLGLGSVFILYSELQIILRYVGAAYLLYLAYKITLSRGVGNMAKQQPLSFFQAALFQYVNPKAWLMAITLASSFAIDSGYLLLNVVIIVFAHGLVSWPCVTCWLCFGSFIRRFLNTPSKLKIFNIIMAILLALTCWIILTG